MSQTSPATACPMAGLSACSEPTLLVVHGSWFMVRGSGFVTGGSLSLPILACMLQPQYVGCACAPAAARGRRTVRDPQHRAQRQLPGNQEHHPRATLVPSARDRQRLGGAEAIGPGLHGLVVDDLPGDTDRPTGGPLICSSSISSQRFGLMIRSTACEPWTSRSSRCLPGCLSRWH